MSRPIVRSGARSFDLHHAGQRSVRLDINNPAHITITDGFTSGTGFCLYIHYMPNGTWYSLEGLLTMDLDVGVNRVFIELPTILAAAPIIPTPGPADPSSLVYRGLFATALETNSGDQNQGEILYRTGDGRLEIAFNCAVATLNATMQGAVFVPYRLNVVTV
jgi:hypothetical protein